MLLSEIKHFLKHVKKKDVYDNEFPRNVIESYGMVLNGNVASLLLKKDDQD